MTHRKAVFLMVVATLLWSIAGVVTRHLEAARSFEITFWRSAFNALALSIAFSVMRGAAFWRRLARSPWPVWASGLCWSVMFTAFMVGITLTSVANVLVTMSIGPLLTALMSRFVLGHRLAARTWGAIGVAGAGIAWMFGNEAGAKDADQLIGIAVAFCVPVAAAINWTLLQHVQHGKTEEGKDMMSAVLIGALVSMLGVLPWATPFQASAHDLTLLALLGVFQLAVPCLLVVRAARVLPGPEVSLLGLLEVILGVTWAWLGAGEAPSVATLVGGTLVIGALVVNELLALRAEVELPVVSPIA
ncbi:MAG: DMT family transporter [Rhizobacter sp.]|jgi:drug/metabolite transporter (DMT)-like permease|nr:DMT family transporter [Burkholderiaceae bacterium]MCO5122749.1 DMT family transporter [Rhizobacter sp.]